MLLRRATRSVCRQEDVYERIYEVRGGGAGGEGGGWGVGRTQSRVDPLGVQGRGR
jgi:hypothetical protein